MNLNKIIKPKSIAIIGISLSNPFNPANVIYHKNRHRYKAKTYCVNPKGGDIYGQQVYKSISDIPEKIDTVVISIKSDFVPAILKECIQAEVSGAIIISGGFTESGKEDLQNEIARIALENDFPVIGPNCLGVFFPPFVDTFFLSSERLIQIDEGSVSLISQSGGILVDQLIKLTQEGVGVSKALSIGNKAVIDEVEMLKYLKQDKDTKVIGIYIEGFKPDRGRDFINEINSAKKPVVLIKSGKTPGGNRAVSSHTASIAGDYFVFSEIVNNSAAIEAKSETEFVSFCESLAAYPGARIKGIGIITASGGHGAMASDGCFSNGINVPEIPNKDKTILHDTLSPSIKSIASLENPVDLTGSAVDNDFFSTTKFFMERDYIDAVMLLLLPYLPGLTSDIGARIAELTIIYKKPLLVYIPHVEKYGIFIEGFEINGIPVAHSVEGAVYMAKAVTRRSENKTIRR
ncbi:MAG: CoA-binding protein [Thermodesulfobacteriota bacterium]|nr:CoA-binding protein [Thermodesulfobacteriota bacterium]